MISVSGGMVGRGWSDVVRADLERARRAHTAGIRDAASALRGDLVADAKGAGLGKLGFAWRADVYPAKGVSLKAAAQIWVKNPRHRAAIEAYTSGAVIRGQGGQYLAIPTDAVPKRAGIGRGGPVRMTPAEVEQSIGRKLRAIPAGPGRFVLVAPGAGRRARPVVMFTLVRQVAVGRRLSTEQIAAAGLARVPAMIEAAWTAEGGTDA